MRSRELEATGAGARWSVRRGDLADLAACAELEDASFESPWTSAMLRAELEAGALLLVGHETGDALPGAAPPPAAAERVVAYAVARAAPPEAELLRIAVHPAVRRRGAGAALMVAAMRRLCAEGVRTLFLEVRSHNEAALGLYRSLGFERVATRRGYYADGGDALVLRLAWSEVRRPSSPRG